MNKSRLVLICCAICICFLVSIWLVLAGPLGEREASLQKKQKTDVAKPRWLVNNEAEQQAEKIISKMTLEQKVGQIMMVYFHGPKLSNWASKQIQEIHPGGVILYDSTDNIRNVQQVMDLTESIQRASLSAGGIPLFIGIDQEGGWIQRINSGVTQFPGNMALGATRSEKLARSAAQISAKELRILGINANFAPVVDVLTNPTNKAIGVRSFGSNPELVAKMGKAILESHNQEGVIATAKHFPGHGDVESDSHNDLPINNKDFSHINKVHLSPFYHMVRGGVPAIMTGHIVLNTLDNLPATLSPKTLAILRKDWAFTGLIISDSMTMGAICRYWDVSEAAVKAFRAGVDVLLFGADPGHSPSEWVQVHKRLIAAVSSGEISIQRLDESVKRILMIKHSYRIIDDPFPRRDKTNELDVVESRHVSDQIARSALTLAHEKRLPSPLDAETIVLWPEEHEHAGRQLAKYSPGRRLVTLPTRFSAETAITVLNQIDGKTLVIVGSYDGYAHDNWMNLIRSVYNKTDKTLVASMRSPTEILVLPKDVPLLCLYDDGPASIRALDGFLCGGAKPSGNLPVEWEAVLKY